jgi:hypothetical protein
MSRSRIALSRFCVHSVLSLLVVLSAFSVLSAQTDSTTPRPRRALVGALAGYSRSDLIGPEATQLRSRQGSVTGVYLLVPISGRLSFRPELLFSLKGGRTQTGSALLDIELAYLEMPMLAKYSFSRRRVRPVIFSGPALSLQIGCDVQFTAAEQASRSTCGEGTFSLFRSFDVGVVAGGGVEVRWPQSAIALETRYTAGLRSILDASDVRNRAYGLVVALTF